MIKFLLTIMVLIVHNNSFASGQISNLITPVSYFVDHAKQLNDLKSNLNKYRQASLVGTSGIGKTQAARMYAYENKDDYDLIWIIDCNLDINVEFVKLAKQLNKVEKTNLPEDAKSAKKEVMEYLTNKDKWLLVFDNLKVGDNKKIKDMIDWEHNGNIIFCSQEGDMLPHIVEITKFNKEDAITLANNILENKDQDYAKFLAESFKGYPILIVQGAQLLNQIKGLDKEEYEKKIQQSADKIKLNITLAIKELNPNAAKLLYKIALINNQSFSKQLLNIITDDPASLSDEIYQLSKFMLISNTDPDEQNPVFEMHDAIAQKIAEMNVNNRKLLEEIIASLPEPKGSQAGHIWRTSNTIPDNLESILQSSEKYDVTIYSLLRLRAELFVLYVNSQNLTKEKQMIEWFETQDRKGDFKLWAMSKYQKYLYARYLGLIGVYYKMSAVNYTVAMSYFTRALDILNTLSDEYNPLKFNLYAHLSGIEGSLGDVNKCKEGIDKLQELFKHGVKESDIFIIYYSQAKLFSIQGKYTEALEYIDKTKESLISNGLKINDLHLAVSYILRAELLNYLERYKEAYTQAQQLYEMHKLVKNENHEIFGRIYTQMARSELGVGKIEEANDHIAKAIAIFLADEDRNPKDADYSEDPDLASSYVVQGDIFFAQNELKKAIESYKRAHVIYFYLYRGNSKNVAHVSYLYTQGAKASCMAKDLYNYKSFGQPQVKEFGVDHPNTIAMFEYCKQYNMDLWAEEN